MSGIVIEFHECGNSLETIVEGDEAQGKAPTKRCTHVNLDGHRCGFHVHGWQQIMSHTGQWHTTREAVDAYRKAQDDART